MFHEIFITLSDFPENSSVPSNTVENIFNPPASTSVYGNGVIILSLFQVHGDVNCHSSTGKKNTISNVARKGKRLH